MKQDSPEGDAVLKPTCSSSPSEESDERNDDNGYDLPIDLRKKSSKDSKYPSNGNGDTEVPVVRTRNVHVSGLNTTWQKIFLNSLPSPTLSSLHIDKSVSDPRLSDSLGKDVASEPNTRNNTPSLPKSSNDDKENQCDCSCRREDCDSLLDLRKQTIEKSGLEPRGTNCPYRTDKDSNPTLIRFLEARALSPHRQDDIAEDLSSTKAPKPSVVASQKHDTLVKRSSSCSRLFEITSESLVERLMRARCKSDSEIQHRQGKQSLKSGTEEVLSHPPCDRTTSLTLKRRILGGITAADKAAEDECSKVARIEAEPAQRLEPCSPPSDQPVHQETLLQQLRQLAPAALPFSIYAYYTQIMQRLHEHELLKRHLEGMAASTAHPGMAQVASSSGLEPIEDSDDLGGEAFNCNMRKRAPRALTGKHVKHGTGASPATLLTLRQKIQERQRARQLGLLEPGLRNMKNDRTRKGFAKGASNAKKQPMKK